MLPWSSSLDVSQAMLLLTSASARVVICCQTAQDLKIIISPAVPCFLFEMGQVKTLKALITNRCVCEIYFSCIKTKLNSFYILKQKWNIPPPLPAVLTAQEDCPGWLTGSLPEGTGPTEIQTPFLGFRVQTNNHDTMRAGVILYTSCEQLQVKER